MAGYIKKCPECQSINLTYDEHKGEVICQDCGLVVEEKMVDTGQELHGQFDKAEKKGRTETLDIGITTYHGHFKRFKDFYEKAVKKGMIGKGDFRLHEIPTPETEEDRKYEASFFRNLVLRFKLETMSRYRGKKGEIKHAEPNPFLRWGYKLRDIFR